MAIIIRRDLSDEKSLPNLRILHEMRCTRLQITRRHKATVHEAANIDIQRRR